MSKLPVKVKKLNDLAKLPTRADIGSAGIDLVAVTEKTVFEGAVSYIEYGTGLAFEIPPGFMGLLFPRSSISSNTSLVLANSIGLLDESFRGEVTARFKSLLPAGGKKYKLGDRIVQLVIVPYPEVELEEVSELSQTSRGTGSYGSSGR